MSRLSLVALKEDAVHFAKASMAYPGAYSRETIANKLLEIAEALSQIVDDVPERYMRFDPTLSRPLRTGGSLLQKLEK